MLEKFIHLPINKKKPLPVIDIFLYDVYAGISMKGILDLHLQIKEIKGFLYDYYEDGDENVINTLLIIRL